ncbi:glycosyltransferase family 9 protein [Telluribacter sp. SYSU D00476]|uniref:glycosyltransferase family 9 protein n=1 Tax=Telluribacter sp. SYSU D00476 TaxID=2811430 RepID=UPI001FF243DC|nr:glycosyltransferase family 9 protein [Telluribacter sp. SYSU D00476]
MKQRILIYRLGSLGDTVMALPCFHLVKEKFADAEIILLTNKPVASKAAPIEAVLGSINSFFFDKAINYPIGTRNPLLLLSLIVQIRRLGISTVINITAARSEKSAARDKLFFRLAGIKEMIGFPETKEDFKVVEDPATGECEWEARRLSRRIESIGKIDLKQESYWNLRLTDEERGKARELLKQVPLDSKIVAISIGTKRPANDWGLNNWVNLLEKLRTDLSGWTLLAIGAEEEFQLAEQCLAAWGGSSLNLCGKSSPRVSAAILQKAKLFLGHDSGPMHLASGVGTPCVGVFSARNLPGRWYPRGENNKIIYHRVDCAGCGLEECIVQNKKCISSITVDEVHSAVIQTIKIGAKALA